MLSTGTSDLKIRDSNQFKVLFSKILETNFLTAKRFGNKYSQFLKGGTSMMIKVLNINIHYETRIKQFPTLQKYTCNSF